MATSFATDGIVVFGYDEQRRPRAGTFDASHVLEATKMAKTAKMGCATLLLPELAALRKELQPGNLAARGKAIVPIVETALYEKLLIATGLVGRPPITKSRHQLAAERAAAKAAQPRAVAKHWDEIGVGQLVLASDSDPENGWYEAIVLEQTRDDAFRLIYRDYDEEITRTRLQLALLPPA